MLLRHLLACLLLACTVFAAKNTGPSTALYKEDQDNIVSQLNSRAKEWSSDLEAAHHAVWTIQNLGGKVNNKDDVCNFAKRELSSGKSSVEAMYHATRIFGELKCGDKVSSAVVDTLKKAIKDGEDLQDLVYAALAVDELVSLNLATFSEDITKVVDRVADLAEPDASFKRTPKSADGSVHNTGLALQLFGKLWSKVSTSDKKTVEDLKDKLEDLTSLGDEDTTLDWADADDQASRLETTSTLVKGLVALAEARGKSLADTLTPAQVSLVAEFFLRRKQASDANTAFYVVQGLRALQSKQVSQPIVAVLDRTAIQSSAKGDDGNVVVRVTDLFGGNVSGAKVTLVKAAPTGANAAAVLSNVDGAAVSGDNSRFKFDFLGAKPDLGFYNAALKVVASGYSTIEATRSLKLLGKASLTDLEIAVTDSRDAKIPEASKHKAVYPARVRDVITLEKKQYLRVSFRIKGATRSLLVDQAFVRIVSKSGAEHLFAAVPQAGEDRVYSLSLGLEDNAPQFNYQSGEYNVEIVIGDAFLDTTASWDAATVKFTFKAAPKTDTTKAVAPGSSASRRTGALPDIEHMFRKPDPRPSKVVSSAFTLAVLAPFVILLIGFLAVGANINRLFSTSHFFYGTGFLVCIGANAALIVIYWLRLNMVTTLGYLAILALPTMFFGQKALSSLALSRS